MLDVYSSGAVYRRNKGKQIEMLPANLACKFQSYHNTPLA